MRTLAFFLSLPSTLLLWSLTHFIAALAGYTFSRKWSTAFGLPPAIMMLCLAILMVFTMGFFWLLFRNSDLKDGQTNSSYLTKIKADAYWFQRRDWNGRDDYHWSVSQDTTVPLLDINTAWNVVLSSRSSFFTGRIPSTMWLSMTRIHPFLIFHKGVGMKQTVELLMPEASTWWPATHAYATFMFKGPKDSHSCRHYGRGPWEAPYVWCSQKPQNLPSNPQA